MKDKNYQKKYRNYLIKVYSVLLVLSVLVIMAPIISRVTGISPLSALLATGIPLSTYMVLTIFLGVRGMNKYSWQGPFYDGKKALEKGELADALECFQRALQLNDEKVKIWYYLAFTLQELHEYDEAINAYEEALKINNARMDSAWKGLTDRAIKIQLSHVYRDLGDYQKALDTISERLKWTTHDDRIYREIALFQNDLGEYQKAIEAAEKSLEINRKDGIAFTYQGFAYMKLGKLEKARKLLEKALEIDPYFARSHYNMALYYLEVNQKEKALESCEKSLHVDKNFAESKELKEKLTNNELMK